MTPEEERRAKKTEYMRRWRAANPDRANENARRSMAKWRADHPEEWRSYFKKWRDDHPESVKETNRRRVAKANHLRATDAEWRDAANAKANARYAKLKGIPETEFQARFQADNPTAVSMDRVRPDFYIPGDGFVEIKRALPFLKYQWRITSVHFPGLYFPYGGTSKAANNVDAQFAMQPKPLLVVVFHAFTGEELTRKIVP